MTNNQLHNLFYVSSEKINDNEIEVAGEQFNHIKNVLRKNLGATIFVTDGNGHLYKSEISQIAKSFIKTEISNKEYFPRKNLIDVTLAFVPIKGWRNDFIVEKTTELGITKFITFISKFSVITDLSQTKLKRLNTIALSAMLQSQQYYMPEIAFLSDLNALPKTFKDFDLVCLADQKGESNIQLGKRSILYIVGPEGGFDTSEVDLFKKNGAHLLSLGSNRLRSETAAICGVAKILTAYSSI